jgi:hypothetical protein
MLKTVSAPASYEQPHERRRLERKPTLLRAVIVEANAQNARNCLILDINAGGAQVSTSIRYPNGTEVYLLDVGNQIAHHAKLVWSKADRSGLSFVESHRIGTGPPLHLSFLWRLLLEAKLQDIERNIGSGISAGSAFMSAGLSGADLDLMAQRAAGDAGFEEALHRARRLRDVDGR